MIIAKGRLIILYSGSAEFPLLDHVMLHDDEGTSLRKCSAYFMPMPTVFKRAKITGSAYDYFRDDEGLVSVMRLPYDTAFFDTGEVVTAIRYFRDGAEDSMMIHDFDIEVPLFQDPKSDSFRLEMPDSCAWNERGFVWP